MRNGIILAGGSGGVSFSATTPSHGWRERRSFFYPLHDPHRYGLVEIGENGHALSIDEKPPHPKPGFVVAGLDLIAEDN